VQGAKKEKEGREGRRGRKFTTGPKKNKNFLQPKKAK
jgi:hypothetical protein